VSENGDPKKSAAGEVFSLLEDQIELASLEWTYEKKQSVRRIGALAAAALLVLTAFVMLQVTIVVGLVRVGLPVAGACLALAAVYAVVAGLLTWISGRRDPGAGVPFQGTRQELRHNLRWIRQLFS